MQCLGNVRLGELLSESENYVVSDPSHRAKNSEDDGKKSGSELEAVHEISFFVEVPKHGLNF